MARFPTSPQVIAIVEQADHYFYSGHRKEAIAHYSKALSIEPDCVYALVQRGLALQEDQHLDNAINDYNKALKLDPQYGPAYYGRGWAKSRLKDFSGELEDAYTGLKLDPDNPGMYFRRIATALTGLKRYDEALQVFSRAIDLDSNDGGTILNRGVCYLQINEFDKAIKDFDKAIALDPKWTWAYFLRGVAYEKLGNPNAIKDIETALHYDPNYQPAIEAKQRLLRQHKSNMTKPDSTKNNSTTSIVKIIRSDYLATLAFLSPLVACVFYIVSRFSEKISPSDIILPVIFLFISMAGMIILILRVHMIKNLIEDGLETIATITDLSFIRDRGRVDYVYMFQGKKYISGNAIMKNKQTRALQTGQQVVLIVDRDKPKRALIRDLYK